MQRLKSDTKTAGGIFLPDSAVKDLNEAKVLAVGPGLMDKKGNKIPMGVAMGDRVLIPQVSSMRAGGEGEGRSKGGGVGGSGVRVKRFVRRDL